LHRLRIENLILPIVALLMLVADQVSKGWIVARLEVGQSMDLASWLAPVFRLTYVTNTGVVFGLLPGMGDLFVIVAAVVVGVLLLYYRYIPPGQVLIRIALGLQLGGALGNLTDRLVRGSVVDFLDLNFWPLERWPVFNLADASIVAGVGLLVVAMLEEQREPPPPEEADG
jgi:signal peptidase II